MTRNTGDLLTAMMPHARMLTLLSASLAPAQVHHVTPKAKGGTDDPGNLLSVCHPCHKEADRANRGHRTPRGFGLDGYPIWD